MAEDEQEKVYVADPRRQLFPFGMPRPTSPPERVPHHMELERIGDGKFPRSSQPPVDVCELVKNLDDAAVNHPPHYTKHPSGVECITVTEHMNFNVGNAVKYLWRAGSKNNLIEDLKKARWYVDREILRQSAGAKATS